VKARVERVLGEDGLKLDALRIRFPKDSYFSKGDRAAVVAPAGMKHETAADELYKGRRRVTLRFELPRGCYATILVKRVTDVRV
jgi:tRNA pseudouridine13 synthase